MTTPEEKRKQITDQNEEYTEQWFNTFDFCSTKPDKNKQLPNSDRYFDRPDIGIICEVKTIFSGGQSGLDSHQYQRRIDEVNRSIQRAKEELPSETSLIVNKDDLDFAAGKKLYKRAEMYYEDEYKKLCYEIKQSLENDERVRYLPFSVTISFSSLYTFAKKDDALKKQFFEQLVEYILWANENHLIPNYPYINSQGIFTIRYAERQSDGTRKRGVDAHVQIWGPSGEPKLEVGFPEGGTPYNESSVEQNIRKAVLQLKSTFKQKVETSKKIFKVIAIWSESSNISTLRFTMELVGLPPGELPERYYIFDWAFAEYPDLDAIIFFERPPIGDLRELDLNKLTFFTFGLIITNPFIPDIETTFNQIFTNNCKIIKGLIKE